MKNNRKKILLFLCYANLIGGMHSDPLFAAHNENDNQLLTSERQNQVTGHSYTPIADFNNQIEKIEPDSQRELDKQAEKDIKQKEEANENNEWIASMLEWTVNEAGDTYNTRKKAIDDKYKEQKAALEKKHAAINQQIEEKSKQDDADFRAGKKKKKEKEKAALLAIDKKREEEALRAKIEREELQRKIDALKRKNQSSNAIPPSAAKKKEDVLKRKNQSSNAIPPSEAQKKEDVLKRKNLPSNAIPPSAAQKKEDALKRKNRPSNAIPPSSAQKKEDALKSVEEENGASLASNRKEDNMPPKENDLNGFVAFLSPLGLIFVGCFFVYSVACWSKRKFVSRRGRRAI